MSKQKVTIYSAGSFIANIRKQEAYLESFSLGKYAQYNDALTLVYKPKGKRSFYQRTITPVAGCCEVLILDGWGHPEPQGDYITTVKDDCTHQEGKYLSHSPEWLADFNKMINPYLDEHQGKILLDSLTPIAHDLCKLIFNEAI